MTEPEQMYGQISFGPGLKRLRARRKFSARTLRATAHPPDLRGANGSWWQLGWWFGFGFCIPRQSTFTALELWNACSR